MNFALPSEAINNLWNRTPRYVKLTFIFTVTLGFLVHMFVLTNYLMNTDGAGFFYSGVIDLKGQGRWFYYYSSIISNALLPVPWLNGLWVFSYIGISACIIASCLNIRSCFSCLVLSGLMVSSPILATNLFFTPFAPANFSALFLACLAVLFANKKRYAFLIGSGLLACSLGVYQSFYPVAAGLCVMILILEIVEARDSLQNIFFKGCRFFAFLILGLLFYLLLVWLTTDGGQHLSGHHGVNKMFQPDIGLIISSILNAYKAFYYYYWNNFYGLFSQAYSILCIVLLAIGVGFICRLVYVNRVYKHLRGFILLGLLLLILPLAICFVAIINSLNGQSTQLLRAMYGLVLAPIFILALLEASIRSSSIANLSHFLRTILFKTACWVSTAGLVVLVYNDALSSNYLYTHTYIAYEQGYAWGSELIQHMKKIENYKHDMEVLFIDKDSRRIKTGNRPRNMFRGANSPYPQNFNSYPHFFEIFLGLPNPGRHLSIRNPNHVKDLDKLAILDEVLAMPTYPDEGSIKVLGNKIVVNCSKKPNKK